MHILEDKRGNEHTNDKETMHFNTCKHGYHQVKERKVVLEKDRTSELLLNKQE